MSIRDSQFIITDDVYHKEVLKLIKNDHPRVICHKKSARIEIDYDPKLYFISENLLEIATEISQELKYCKFHHIKCSKIYMYTPGM